MNLTNKFLLIIISKTPPNYLINTSAVSLIRLLIFGALVAPFGGLSAFAENSGSTGSTGQQIKDIIQKRNEILKQERQDIKNLNN